MVDSKCSGSKLALIPCHNKKQHPDTSFGFNKLVDELVEEILIRLPTRSAFQFKVVCKKWYSLISSPSFVSRFIHLRHHRVRDIQVSFIFQNKHPYHFQIMSDSSSLSNLYGKDVFQLSYLPCPPQHLKLVASFTDLILCSYLNPITNQTIYYVSNILTKQWIALPPAPVVEGPMRFVSIGFLCIPPTCSQCKLVDDSSGHKFMVVKLNSEWSSLYKAQLFSSEDQKWRTLFVSSSLSLEPFPQGTCFVAFREMLHLLNIYSDCIVVYDPLNTPNEFSRAIRLPIRVPSYDDSCIGVSQGHLRLVKFSIDDFILDVWELEDYDSGLWNLVYKVHLTHPNLLQEEDFFEYSLLSLHPENGDVIYFWIFNQVVTINMRSMIIEGYHPINKDANVNGFLLADQWWPTAVSSLLQT